MPDGNLVVFDAGLRRYGVKHHCFSVGQRISSGNTAAIRDLFDTDEPEQCPSCGEYGMRMVEGCMTCPNCGHSKCA